MGKINDSDAVPSPCIRNCCLNEDQVCLGCFRSVDEITSWNHLSNHERLQVLENSQQRQQGSD